MAAMAIMMGGHVRVGVEDTIYVRRGVLANNAQLVEKVVRLANEFEREVATPDEARAMLGLKGCEAVNYSHISTGSEAFLPNGISRMGFTPCSPVGR